MKIFDLSNNLTIQSGMRQLINFGTISDLPAFAAEIEKVLKKIEYYQAMEERYGELLEEIHSLRQSLWKREVDSDHVHISVATER